MAVFSALRFSDLRSLVILASIAVTLAACSGGGGGGGGSSSTGSKSILRTETSYAADATYGLQQTITTYYTDGSQNVSVNYPKSTAYSFSDDGSQRTPLYTFPNGAERNGTAVTGNLSNPSFNAQNQTVSFSYSFGDNVTSPVFTVPIASGTDKSFATNGAGQRMTVTYPYTVAGKTYRVTFQLNSTSTAYEYGDNGKTQTPVYAFADTTTYRGTSETGTSPTSRFSDDGSIKYVTYTFSNGQHETPLTGTLSPKAFNLNGTITFTYNYPDTTSSQPFTTDASATPTVNYTDGGKTKTITSSYLVNGQSKSVSFVLNSTGTTYSYSDNGKTQTPVYAFADNTINPGTPETGTLSKTDYSTDGSQKYVTYTFSNGPHMTTLTGTLSPTAFNLNGTITFTYNYPDSTSSQTFTTDPSDPQTVNFVDDGKTKTITTSYLVNGQRTTVQFQLAGTPTNVNLNTAAQTASFGYKYDDGTTYQKTFSTRLNTETSASYSSDGSVKTATYTYFDGSGNPQTVKLSLTGTLTTPIYSADGSQKTLVYQYQDGTTRNGVTYQGTLQSSSGFQADHVTKTVTYSFGDQTSNTATIIVEPRVDVKPTYQAADYSKFAIDGTIIKPITTAASGQYADTSAYTANGSSSNPFRQATLTPNGPTGANAINDPNAYILAPTTGLYNLSWGTPDTAGRSYANYFKDGASSFQLTSTYTFFGQPGNSPIISKNDPSCKTSPIQSGCSGPTILSPTQDVISAWKQGWTGKIQNYSLVLAEPLGTAHSLIMTDVIRFNAFGAQIYGFNNNDYKFYYSNGGAELTYDRDYYFKTIVVGYGADIASSIKRPNTPSNPWTVDELLKVRQDSLPNGSYAGISANYIFTNYLGGFRFLYHPDYFNDAATATLVKQAGDDHIDAQYEPVNYIISRTPPPYGGYQIRFVFVGALTGDGSVSSPVKLADFSNVAGTDPSIQSRFLTASGKLPYDPSTVLIDGKAVNPDGSVGAPTTSNDGSTSFAAARVGAYAQIVGQKFSNLDGSQISNILLATARYDTLACYTQAGGCDKSIYGAGEASLSRALAPVGYLK